ncbi:MAG: RNA 2',3'-cyclic phosphodiesterase [Anaerolineales bacterium]
MILLRAFIAIEIPQEIKRQIAGQTAELRRMVGSSVRWVTPENIHLTLKFLGEISPTNIDLLAQALKTEVGQHLSFEMNVNGLGAFPNVRRPRVIWIGLDAPPDLTRLQHHLETTTARLGYISDDKPFSPHLTIGRVREQLSSDESQALRSALESAKVGALGKFTVKSVHLFQSELKPAGPIYTCISTAALGG